MKLFVAMLTLSVFCHLKRNRSFLSVLLSVSELPGKPDSLEAECQSTKCVITWSQSRSGDLTMKSFEYSVQVHGPSILSQRIVKAQRFEVTKLLPNRKYTVDIITRVKNSNGNTWSSDAAQVTFTTRTVGM